MSQKPRFLFFSVLVLACVAVIILFHQPEKEELTVVPPPMVGGDEVYPDQRVYVDGKLSLGTDAYQEFKSPAMLYVFAQPVGESKGEPIALRQIESPGFPMRLFLTSGDNIGPTKFYDGEIKVTARLSQSGDRDHPRSDDWEGSVVVGGKSKRLVELVLKPVGPAS